MTIMDKVTQSDVPTEISIIGRPWSLVHAVLKLC